MKYPDQKRRGPRVDLVAADDALRSSLRMLLSASGMTVREYRTANAYLTTRLTTPGCLVADCQLADMRNRQYCTQLVELSRQIPVVVLTSSAEEFELAGCASPNIRVVRKPFAGELLIDAVLASTGGESFDGYEDCTPLDAAPAAS